MKDERDINGTIAFVLKAASPRRYGSKARFTKASRIG